MATEWNEKTDYYELLGVTESATEEELKRAYRKAAMKWHPDRNHGNEVEATRVFQLIEHAYSILSDNQERAWYDDHRNFNYDEQGEMVATNVDIYGLFKAGAFHGFEDDARGFFNVFGKAFEKLAEEEKLEAPKFGWSSTPYEEVEKFYAFWTCFKTTRSFAFEDMYQLKDAPNSWYRRQMDKENKSLRQKAMKEFISAVREMALFAKKRDPRITAEVKRREELLRKKKEEDERKREEKRRRDAEEIERITREHAQKPEFSEESLLYLNEFDKDKDDDPEWFCDYCGRIVDNANVFKTHCATKKHKKMVATAKRDFLNDPTIFEHTAFNFILLGLDESEILAVDPNVDMNNLVSPRANKKKKPQRGQSQQLEAEDDEEEEEYEQKGKKNKKGKNKNDDDDEDEKPKKGKNNNNKKGKNKNDDDEDEEEDLDEEELRAKRLQAQPLSKKERRKLKMQKQQQKKIEQEKAAEKAKYADQPKLTKQEKKLRAMMEARKNALFDYSDFDEEEEPKKEEPKKEETAKKEEEEKNEETKKQEQDKGKQKGKGNQKNDGVQRAKKGHCPPGMFMCRKCKAIFPSKTKLFAHLEESGHATAY
ncbi:U1 zinc finger family protein [Trichomonas vaginalis G3]|uniref:U1 zinc finger family protein n=1 Tax=Trichomonas vaginalis (strain ATCC PRA-98 / G3) TaxID=412133 RepID=A2EI42_TRIV3|nr:zinc ion binding [Trichomonas vaginalis G3]EAY07681.1 U1 zinc finger family protein [Trichomonas vaginalis G3]KAI5518518.1 zinc ion binding [Trichomonas vaginalis G3]|eukprot:XP_001319904.1 U1 zinc finger family protein [Trichomonas vaginalis G3]